MLERGVRIPALMSWVLVLRQGSDTQAPRSVSLWECAVWSSLGRTLFCPRVFCCVARSLCFYRLCAFMLCLVLCGTQLVYFIGCMLSCCHVLCEHVAYEFFISCVFMSCFAHGWWFVCCKCACGFCFLCAMCSHVICLDPTHLVTCLLIHFPQLLSLVTLLICSL